MAKAVAFFYAFVCLAVAIEAHRTRTNATDEVSLFGGKRKGKFFSLFNIVTFQNELCSTQASLTGSTTRNGTCFSTTECINNGGIASGNCAAGFGSCCLFIINAATGGTITQNNTYIQNPGFPSALTTTDTITYTVQRSSNDVCELRLDFETFVLMGVANTNEADGGACTDTFTVTVMTGSTIPVICGVNSGQHMFVDIGNAPGATATLTFAFMGDSTVRMWDIRVSQIECSANCVRPPIGCLQFLIGISGRIQSFNYQPTVTTESHLANQRYNVCIRREEGFNCIVYSACADLPQANSWFLAEDLRDRLEHRKAQDYVHRFSVDATSPALAEIAADTNTGVLMSPAVPAGALMTALDESSCTEDFISIPGSSSSCSCGSPGGVTRTRYCGTRLNVIGGLTETPTPAPPAIATSVIRTFAPVDDIPICDCSPPFNVAVVFDGTSDDETVGSPDNLGLSSGFCLNFQQIAC